MDLFALGFHLVQTGLQLFHGRHGALESDSCREVAEGGQRRAARTLWEKLESRIGAD